MGGFNIRDGVGDNKEFSVATTGVITVYFQNESSLISDNDDPTNRNYYYDTSASARKYVLRTNQTVTIPQINDVVMTNPITVAIGDGSVTPASGRHKEEFDHPVVQSIKIDIKTANTNIKIRRL